MGQMKPGKIVDGKDISIENANRIKTNMDDISKITNSPIIGNYDFKGPTAANGEVWESRCWTKCKCFTR